MKTISLGPWLGINNRLPDTALHVDKKGDFLPYAENVDVDSAGNLRRRESELQIQAMLDGHSLHMTSATTGYLMRGSSLYAITLPAYGQSFVKLLSNSDPVCWLEVGDSLYYSNGTDSGRIAAGTFYPLGLPTPAAPSCSVLAGAMFAGTYKVAVSYYNSSTKEEGGVSAVDNPVLAAAGGLRVPLPGVTDGATHVNVYLSSVNGSKPMWVGSYVTGTAYVDFTAMPAQHQEAAQRFDGATACREVVHGQWPALFNCRARGVRRLAAPLWLLRCGGRLDCFQRGCVDRHCQPERHLHRGR